MYVKNVQWNLNVIKNMLLCHQKIYLHLPNSKQTKTLDMS